VEEQSGSHQVEAIWEHNDDTASGKTLGAAKRQASPSPPLTMPSTVESNREPSRKPSGGMIDNESCRKIGVAERIVREKTPRRVLRPRSCIQPNSRAISPAVTRTGKRTDTDRTAAEKRRCRGSR
jgi:hypothetical protein